jgi:hypothetical protein
MGELRMTVRAVRWLSGIFSLKFRMHPMPGRKSLQAGLSFVAHYDLHHTQPTP